MKELSNKRDRRDRDDGNIKIQNKKRRQKDKMTIGMTNAEKLLQIGMISFPYILCYRNHFTALKIAIISA